MLTPKIASCGNFEIVIANPKTGKVIWSYKLEQGGTIYGENKVDIPVKPIGSGAKSLYFWFTANDDDTDNTV